MLRQDAQIFHAVLRGSATARSVAHVPDAALQMRQFLPQTLDQLRGGKQADLVMQTLNLLTICDLTVLSAQASLSLTEVEKQLSDLENAGEVILLSRHTNPTKTQVISSQNWQTLRARVLSILTEFHQKFPLKAGITREQLRPGLKLNPDQFDLVMERLKQQGDLLERGTLVWAAGHAITLTPQQEAQASALLERFQQSPYSPPDASSAETELGRDLLEGLIASERLVRVSDAVLFTPSAVDAMKTWVREAIQANGSVSLAQFRDHFKTSRKYAAAFLEYLDAIGYTLRKEDVRVLRTTNS